jgi:hypothetical protein
MDLDFFYNPLIHCLKIHVLIPQHTNEGFKIYLLPR